MYIRRVSVMVKKLFGIDKPIIGALHFTPLLGFSGFNGFEDILKAAVSDAKAFESGGIDAIIIENNYDLPHRIMVEPETVASMTYLGSEIKKKTKLRLGVSVLWNDYRAAFAIAKVIGAEFIRVPAFVDDAKTDFGTAIAEPEKVKDCRKRLSAEHVQIFADLNSSNFNTTLTGNPVLL